MGGEESGTCEEKSRILIVGGTGYIGRRFVRASLSLGHPTYVLFRPFTGLDIEKLQMLFSFRNAGAHLVKGSFDDKESLVAAVKQVDVVICAIAGNHIRSHAIPEQIKLVEAIKEAGNIKRYLPSEFGIDPDKMMDAIEPGNVTFIDKREVRGTIEAAGIPYTYVSANCFAGYFVGGLAQRGRLTPPTDTVFLYGDSNVKAIWVDEDDVAIYTIKSAVDPRTVNKAVYIRPPANILSHREVIELWEKKSGNVLQKISVSRDEYLNLMKGENLAEQIGMTHFYHIFYDGCLYNFEIGEEGREASQLYPDVKYTTVDAYLDRYLI
ncbi:bifunctional pinoresinol-lariciresinol reductase 2 [Cryptomeria japonica]|uniref:bifunctional pinoresinol-lariciresinol reductase 2 n=1 Tax=Cryptomeria japonica TaxID=3369 RepID=UPI0025AC269A|nr:bifunctional pinoresinol-lariciresinol reductase 2 [Cryptomeria japonica]